MAVYPSTEVYVEDTINGNLDLTPYVISAIKVQYGITDNKITDRMASTGTATFKLYDKDSIFNPESPTWDSRFINGCRIFVKIIYNYAGTDRYKTFAGRLSNIKYDNQMVDFKTFEITVSDWFENASTEKLAILPVEVNKRPDEVIDTILNSMVIQPANRDLKVSSNTFASVFDSTNQDTRVATELNRIVQSEYGFLYLRHGSLAGETLVFENKGYRELQDLAVISYIEGFLTKDDGGYILQQNGDKLLLYKSNSFDIDRIIDLNVEYGKNLINKLEVKAYPKTVDVVSNVLVMLDTAIELTAGETKDNLEMSYKNPSIPDAYVSGYDMITPVATTDYQMWSNSDGTGTNLTSNLVVTANYGSSRVVYTLQNTGGTLGYVTKLQARGKAIYDYNPITYIAEDTTSQSTYGVALVSLDQKYQSNPYTSQDLSTAILNQFKLPVKDVNSIKTIANIDDIRMLSFIYYDIGDKIYVLDNLYSVNATYCINSMKYSISLGGIIEYTWGLVKTETTSTSDYWELGVSELGIGTILGA